MCQNGSGGGIESTVGFFPFAHHRLTHFTLRSSNCAISAAVLVTLPFQFHSQLFLLHISLFLLHISLFLLHISLFLLHISLFSPTRSYFICPVESLVIPA